MVCDVVCWCYEERRLCADIATQLLCAFAADPAKTQPAVKAPSQAANVKPEPAKPAVQDAPKPAAVQERSAVVEPSKPAPPPMHATAPFKRSEVHGLLDQLFKQRIAFIDGAMGTQIQKFKLQEEDFRGEIYKNHSHELKGNNDVLVLTSPSVIEQIHTAYLESGADIIETNTFNGTWISQADYELQVCMYPANSRTSAHMHDGCTI